MGVSWVKGSCFKARPEVAKQVMDELAAEGRLSPAELVEVSRPKDAPLHQDFFSLSDREAAQKFREYRARVMIGSIVITQDTDEKEVPVRAYFNIEYGKQEYLPTAIIMSDEAKAARLLEIAKKEMISFKAKYAALTELAGVMRAMDAVLEAPAE